MLVAERNLRLKPPAGTPADYREGWAWHGLELGWLNLDGNTESITDYSTSQTQGGGRHRGTGTAIVIERDPIFGPIWVFDGATSAILTGNGAGLASRIQSWEIWFKTSTDYSAKKGIIAQNALSTSLRGFSVYISTGNAIVAQTADSIQVRGTVTGPVVNDGRWHHVFCAFDNNVAYLALYVDGTFIGSQTPGQAGNASGNNFVVGVPEDTTTFANYTGRIAMVRIWSPTTSVAAPPASTPLTTNRDAAFINRDLVKRLYRDPFGMFRPPLPLLTAAAN